MTRDLLGAPGATATRAARSRRRAPTFRGDFDCRHSLTDDQLKTFIETAGGRTPRHHAPRSGTASSVTRDIEGGKSAGLRDTWADILAAQASGVTRRPRVAALRSSRVLLQTRLSADGRVGQITGAGQVAIGAVKISADLDHPSTEQRLQSSSGGETTGLR
jgi:hypothetical protein